jgi:hypothetical protein
MDDSAIAGTGKVYQFGQAENFESLTGAVLVVN